MAPAAEESATAALDRIALLADPARTVEPLPGGLTNLNLKVTTQAGVYVARFSDESSAALGIDRDAEHVNSLAAERAGVGAPVLDHRADLGVLVIGFIEGRTLGPADVREPAMAPRLAAAVRTLHEGPAFRGRFDMVERQAAYLRTVTERGYRLPDGYADHAATLAEVTAALAVRDEGLVPCHNDLLAENFIDDGERVWIIDYEYSGMNDACFELGNIGYESGLDPDGLTALVDAYYGRHRRSRVARARLLGAVGQYGWTLWGVIQHEVSALDFDFWAWSLEHYERAVALLTSEELPRLLADAQVAD
ncbi:LPS biosynthesis choline kinase [Nocardioides mangrovicus]|uniref:LPS biosynthesis choline kinase n=1 Tax=Nocardioides mangrovicus TaxID=2478913 RepID=A0A3L8P3P5_9ACTN|nr:choline kinase family protein [Nocardioides mangrovicus]RLV50016.1 LPS biosynthesis choline kinase [Nocardioides mangrovicus]